MFHIQQRDSWDCGLAAAAMVAGVTYEEAASLWREKRGLCPEEMVDLLKTLTDIEWRVTAHKQIRPLCSFNAPYWPVAMLVERFVMNRHYVAVHGSLLHDPLFSGAVLYHRYRAQAVGFDSVIQPCDPDALDVHRTRRRQRVLSELSRELNEVSSLQDGGSYPASDRKP